MAFVYMYSISISVIVGFPSFHVFPVIMENGAKPKTAILISQVQSCMFV